MGVENAEPESTIGPDDAEIVDKHMKEFFRSARDRRANHGALRREQVLAWAEYDKDTNWGIGSSQYLAFVAGRASRPAALADAWDNGLDAGIDRVHGGYAENPYRG